MLPPNYTESENVYEIRFKNTRKAFYRNVNGLRLEKNDFVVVESDRGYDIGRLSIGGVLAQLQMRKRRVKKQGELPRIYRIANESDLESLKFARSREQDTLVRSRVIINDLKLDMKLSEVEFQGDGTKAIFYYIADHRVDFRELIKVLAREFRIRVEMKQIGLRHEAGLVGGIGACGRELCCSTWLTEFKTVSTSAARYQNLSLNPMKISGLCGRLKCCLNYELDAYLDALRHIPKCDKIKTEKGVAFLQKTDIFKGKMWFSYPDETFWHPFDADEVREMANKNAKGEVVPSFSEKVSESRLQKSGESFDFVDVVGQTTLEDKNQGNSRRRKRKPRRGRKGGNRNRNPRSKGNKQKPKK